MDTFKQKYLEQMYEKAGPLSREDFVALQTLFKAVFEISDIELVDKTIDELQPGDSVKLKATIKNVTTGATRQGTIPINDILDVQYDPDTKELMISNEKYTFIQNIDIAAELKAVGKLIQESATYGFTRQQATEMLANVSWSEFEEIRDIVEYSKIQEQSIDTAERTNDAVDLDLF